MSAVEVGLTILWTLLALAVAMNWRSQLAWHRYYERRLNPPTRKSPIQKDSAE